MKKTKSNVETELEKLKIKILDHINEVEMNVKDSMKILAQKYPFKNKFGI